jgi:MATE family multidrug resistance protein
MALLIGLGFALLQQPIIRAALAVYQPASTVADHAETYFRILIWGAPLVLVNYVNLGWLMGQKRIKATLFLQVSANGMNIIIDVVFVFLLEMGVAGVAWATLIAQAYGFLAGLGLIQVHLGVAGIRTHWPGVMDPVAMRRMIMVNGDLLVRTFCLLTMTNLFVAKGSELGSVFLAANAVLFQVQYIVAYFFDGLANASSVFAGDALGLEDFEYFRRTRAITDVYLLGLILLATIVLAMFKGPITHCFTNLEAVVTLCHEYMIWLILYPLAIGPGLVYFGFYTGTTHTIPVRNSMLVALAVFLAAYYLMVPVFHNHGLWLAFILFSLCRSTVLVMGMKGMEQQLFGLKRRHPVVPAI